jgi:hypothetical protein
VPISKIGVTHTHEFKSLLILLHVIFLLTKMFGETLARFGIILICISISMLIEMHYLRELILLVLDPVSELNND